ncbi:hypothetical protein PENCOP_c014G02906 [Penicillium coprophilum]|uniref:Endo-chitosanase n=1 Tax=Penicillium coprophilum TaxID=36646 RepID=A0A1V6UBD8_9EURO|nr:hypothetical protein PENCOP_c014G02906 [Penicillium coprophilum]
MHIFSTLILSSVGLAFAYDVPANLEAIYKAHKTGSCKKPLAKGLDDGHKDGHDMGYCGDIDGSIFLYSTRGGFYGDMDIDCDGANRLNGDCGDDNSGQSQTAFMGDLKPYHIDDLDAGIHPYVVFGTKGYDPEEDGMKPLSVMAVVCGGKLHYAIWGDTNGHTSTGEASLSLGQLCFPDGDITGDNGHTAKDVLYIGFKGKSAVPGSEAAWKAKNSHEFEDSIKTLGDKLVAGLGSGGSAHSWSSGSSSSFVTSARTTKSKAGGHKSTTPVWGGESTTSETNKRTSTSSRDSGKTTTRATTATRATTTTRTTTATSATAATGKSCH